MPAYSYEALQNDGALRKGVIEADSAKAARSPIACASVGAAFGAGLERKCY